MSYAAIHNNGGKIPVTPKMRKFFWAKYYERAGNVTKLKSGKASASKRNVALSSEVQFYKNMALTKRAHITIPQRQFIGTTIPVLLLNLFAPKRTMMSIFDLSLRVWLRKKPIAIPFSI
jgi:hypothetical protein